MEKNRIRNILNNIANIKEHPNEISIIEDKLEMPKENGDDNPLTLKESTKIHEIRRFKVYGDTLGTLENVIETLDAFNTIYRALMLFNVSIENQDVGIILYRLKSLVNTSIFELESDNKFILPGEELVVSKINYNSPGFWEIVGSLNPLTQFREYLNDRHARKKDKQAWENEAVKALLENQKLELENKRIEIENQKLLLQNVEYSIEVSSKKLEIIQKAYSLLEEQGCPDAELREFTKTYVNIFSKLENCINDGRITKLELAENICEKVVEEDVKKEMN